MRYITNHECMKERGYRILSSNPILSSKQLEDLEQKREGNLELTNDIEILFLGSRIN